MKKVLILLLLFALLLPLVSCDKTNGGEETTEPVTTATPPEETELKCTVRTVALKSPVSFHTAPMTAYLADTDAFSVTDYAAGKDEMSAPEPIVLSWNVDFASGENELWYFVVRIWTKSDKSDAKAFLVGRSERARRRRDLLLPQPESQSRHHRQHASRPSQRDLRRSGKRR